MSTAQSVSAIAAIRDTSSTSKAPSSSLAFDAVGNLYDTTTYGGLQGCFENCGVVFKLTPTSKGRLAAQHCTTLPAGMEPIQLVTL